jgi:hypothetical protein
MQKSDLDQYMRLAIRTMPDAASTAQRLSAVITILQTTQVSLREGQPENVHRADAALTVALGTLKLLGDEYTKAAEWVRSSVSP